jgi:cysteine-rich repeat protein
VRVSPLLLTAAHVAALLVIAACPATVERGADCENGRDDDDDELIDCEDPSCALDPVCGSCGNGTTEASRGEACDDGNLQDGDDCTSRCQDPSCGNARLDDGEECDDGNLIAADGCSAQCKNDRCGDRIIQSALEQCEDGNKADGDGCSSECAAEPLPFCGDGLILFDTETSAQLEQCDDGNRQSGDGCSALCTVEGCGDGILQPLLQEQCDIADPFAPANCSGCRIPNCGDGFFTPDEQCDDGNRNNGDGCSESCRAEFCGDRITQPLLGEQCDDANNVCGDGCCFCSLD